MFILKKTGIKSAEEFRNGIERASLKKLLDFYGFITMLEERALEKLESKLESKEREFWQRDQKITKGMLRDIELEIDRKESCKCVFFCYCLSLRT